MKRDIGVTVAGLVNLGCIVGLYAIATKRNNDCYKAECKLVNEQAKTLTLALKSVVKDIEITKLKKELAELKAKYEQNEEES